MREEIGTAHRLASTKQKQGTKFRMTTRSSEVPVEVPKKKALKRVQASERGSMERD